MTSKLTRPMLAAAVDDVSLLRFPLVATPKLDGIRALKVNGKLLSRSLKPIPNVYIRETLEKILPEGADGEIMVGEHFQDVTSAVMSRDGQPNFEYWMFDVFGPEPYEVRRRAVKLWVDEHPAAPVAAVPTVKVASLEELERLETVILSEGYEGVCLRTDDSPYKCGRSTFKEHYLLKLKRFVDGEAKILGFEEQQENTNRAKTNELGLTKRSSAKAGKRGKDTLGKFLVRDTKTGVEFAIGTGEGLTQALRKEIWTHRKLYLGKLVKYKSQDFGVKDAPRLPIFLGFRDRRDT